MAYEILFAQVWCASKIGEFMDKWDYVRKISNMSNRYGDKLINMLNTYNKMNLQEITCEEAKEYYINMLQLSRS